MKIKFTKFKIFFLIIIVFFLYIVGTKIINNTDHNIVFKIKLFVPNSVKHYLKNTIFIIPKLKGTINELEKKNRSLRHRILAKEQFIKEMKNKYFEGYAPFIYFDIKEKNKIIKSKHSKYIFTKFQTIYLDNGKASDAQASAYIEEFNDKILLVNADGIFTYFYKKELSQDRFELIVIPTNIKEIIKYEEFFEKSED